MKPKTKVTIGILTLLTAILGGVSLASAQNDATAAPALTSAPALNSSPELVPARDGFALSPAGGQNDGNDFNFSLKSGESASGKVFIKNFSAETAHFFLYGADPTVSNTGSPAYKTREQSLDGPGTWIAFVEPDLNLAGDEDRVVAFTVTVPEGTEPGEYRAGITMEKTKPSASNPGITIATRVINRASINVLDASDNGAVRPAEPVVSAPAITWQTYYFWISFTLFLASLALLVWSIFYRGKKSGVKPAHRAASPKPQSTGRKPHAKKKRGGR